LRHALILAGGSGTRLWPMSRKSRPKQLLPLVEGRSLLALSYQRLEGLVGEGQRYVCAAEAQARQVLAELPSLGEERFLGEPEGRDTLNAIALGCAVIAREDPEAVVGVFTADHLIEPAERFREIVGAGYGLAEEEPDTLVTFGVTPTGPATGYGYLELGEPLGERARRVRRFKEKPEPDTARAYFEAGPERYLWNSGMFVWRAQTFLALLEAYRPQVREGLRRIAEAWGGSGRGETLRRVYPALPRISVDYAVMEPASADPSVKVAAVPMALSWRDIGSWAAYAEACRQDGSGNAQAARRSLFVDCRGTLAASSDPSHLVAAIGCQDLLIVHTPEATLVCPRSRAEEVKKLQGLVRERFGEEYV
jgi:mannose-1-phosphate guanylyltransferase